MLVRGGNPFVFNHRFMGYNEAQEGILAGQRDCGEEPRGYEKLCKKERKVVDAE